MPISPTADPDLGAQSLRQGMIATTIATLAALLVPAACGLQKPAGSRDGASSGGDVGRTGGTTATGGDAGHAGRGGNAATGGGGGGTGGVGGSEDCRQTPAPGSARGSLLWARLLRGAGMDSTGWIASGDCDTVYALGRTQEAATFGERAIPAGVFLARFGDDRALEWVRSFPVAPGVFGVASRGSKGVVIAGQISDPIDFGNGPRTARGGFADSFLATYSGSGGLMAVSQFGLGDGSNWIDGLATNDDGNILFTIRGSGTVDVGSGPTKLFSKLVQFDPEDRFRWMVDIPNSQTNIAIGADGSAVVVGSRGVMIPGTGNAGTETFVQSHDASGALRWNKTFLGPRASGVAIQTNGDVIVVGANVPDGQVANFGCGALSRDAATFVVAFAVDGDCRWMRSLSGTMGAARVATDNAGGLIVGGETFPGPVDLTSGTTLGGGSFYLERLDLAGDIVWARTLGAPGLGLSMALSRESLWLGGSFTAPLDLGTGEMTPQGPSDGILIKLVP